METLPGRLKREHRTLVTMTAMYCDRHHASPTGGLCRECTELMAYAQARLAKCPYGEAKPTCAKCPVHCYKKAPRERVQEIMRFAGPRMPYRHPWRALLHVFDKLRRAVHPLELRRARKKSS